MCEDEQTTMFVCTIPCSSGISLATVAEETVHDRVLRGQERERGYHVKVLYLSPTERKRFLCIAFAECDAVDLYKDEETTWIFRRDVEPLGLEVELYEDGLGRDGAARL